MDQILWYLADALGLQRCPHIILIGAVEQFRGAVFYCHEAPETKGARQASSYNDEASAEGKAAG